MLILGLKELILPEICGRLLAALTGFHCAFIRAKRNIVSYAAVLRVVAQRSSSLWNHFSLLVNLRERNVALA